MNPDFLVIGAGVAGLRAAIELADAGRVLVVAKDSLMEPSSEYAQGGIAVALSDDEVRFLGKSSHLQLLAARPFYCAGRWRLSSAIWA